MMTETSDSMSDADFWGVKKSWKILKMFFPKKTIMFDSNVFNDSKQVLNDCYVSEKLFIIKQKDFTLIATNEMKDKGFLCTISVD